MKENEANKKTDPDAFVDIEALCRISLLCYEPGEKEKLYSDIADIVRFAAEIDAFSPDTETADCAAESGCRSLRTDAAKAGEDSGRLLSNAKTVDGSYIYIPAVIEE